MPGEGEVSRRWGEEGWGGVSARRGGVEGKGEGRRDERWQAVI